MLRVAIKGVLARKLRLLLTSIAVVLGVGFVSGAFFLTDSLRSSFETIFTEAAQGIDVQVATKEYKDLTAKQATAGASAVPIDLAKVGVPPNAIDQIRDTSGVARVEGTIFEVGAQPVDKKGEPMGGGGAPSFAANWVPDAQEASALRIVKGDAPKADEVLLDATTMDKGDFAIGDDVDVLIQGGSKRETFRISGIVKFGSSNSLNGASITVFETERLQDLLDMGDRFSGASAVADGGVTQTTLKRSIERSLGSDYDVLTGEEFTKEQTDSIDDSFLNVLQNVILGFAAIAVFVGAFTIFNTFTILVGQRTREFGLLRAIGAGRAQVIWIVVVEAVVLGIIASTLGLLAGYGVATLLRAMINSFAGGGIPSAGFPLNTRTIVASYAVGVGVTLVACLLPAWRASRLSPLEALRANSATAGRGWKAPAFGAVLMVLGGLAIIAGFNAGDGASTSTVLTQIGGGFALAILGIALLSRLFILPVTRLLSTVLGRGTSGELATRNVLRNRARSATTASALMIGLALASLVLVFYASLQSTVDKQIDDTLGADVTVYNQSQLNTGTGVVDDASVEKIRNVKGVESIASQRFGGATRGATFDTDRDILGIAAFEKSALAKDGLVELNVATGSADPGDGVLLDVDFAKAKKLQVGDTLQLATAGAESRKLEVRGTYKTNPIVGSVVTSIDTFDAIQPKQLRAASLVFIRTKDGVKGSTVADRIEKALGDDAGSFEVKDSTELRETFTAQLQPILGLVLGMLSLSLVIALFGIGNTLALNVFERTREIGLIRAVGGTRPQVRRMIRIEAVLVALFGAVIGVLVGLGAGAAIVHALADDGFEFAPNVGGLVAVLVAGFAAGLLASILPARRAAKTDVLAAIASE